MESALLGTISFTAFHMFLIVLAGVGAGVFNGVAGGGSLISFPVLLALGLPPLTANITNTIGIWPGYLGSAAGFRREISDQTDRFVRLSPAAGLGAVAGAVLLLTTPSSDFTRIAPWLILGASILFAVQPLLLRAFGDGSHSPSVARPVVLLAATFAASVYGGYFGAGLGVMLLAILGLCLPDSITRTSGLRTVLSILVNGLAAVVFLIHGGLVWEAVALLALGSLVGGWLGAHVALSITPNSLRVVVIVVGLGTAAKLLFF
ncbi:MAG: sulfite exporter TauE/SafE family protein [Acidimicrobiales bacterium]